MWWTLSDEREFQQGWWEIIFLLPARGKGDRCLLRFLSAYKRGNSELWMCSKMAALSGSALWCFSVSACVSGFLCFSVSASQSAPLMSKRKVKTAAEKNIQSREDKCSLLTQSRVWTYWCADSGLGTKSAFCSRTRGQVKCPQAAVSSEKVRILLSGVLLYMKGQQIKFSWGQKPVTISAHYCKSRVYDSNLTSSKACETWRRRINESSLSFRLMKGWGRACFLAVCMQVQGETVTLHLDCLQEEFDAPFLGDCCVCLAVYSLTYNARTKE